MGSADSIIPSNLTILAYQIDFMAINPSIIDILFILSCGAFMVSVDLYHVRYSDTLNLRFVNEAHLTVSALRAVYKSCGREHTFEPDHTCE